MLGTEPSMSPIQPPCKDFIKTAGSLIKTINRNISCAIKHNLVVL